MTELPLLDEADLEGAWSNMPVRPTVREVLARRHEARKYIFDHQASHKVGELIRDCLDLIVDNIEFARPPYPVTYVQVDMRDLWRGWRPQQPMFDTMDLITGYLIAQGHALVLVKGPPKKSEIYSDLGLGLWNFRINHPQSTPMDKILHMHPAMADVGRLAYIFGGQRIVNAEGKVEALYLPDVSAELENIGDVKEGLQWSHSQVAAHFDLNQSYRNVDQQVAFDGLFQGGGDPIILMAALLLLNQPSKYVDFQERPKGARLSPEGKVQTWTKHTAVTIHLSSEAHVKKLIGHIGDRASPILHDVEGHWKNFNKHPGCIHHWEPIGPDRTLDGGYKRYWCPRCLQRRTWQEATVRGDASKGVSTKHYDVTE